MNNKLNNRLDIVVVYFHAFKNLRGARCSSVVRAFAHGAVGREVDPS